MAEKPNTTIAVVGIDIGKNSFHVVGLDERGAIVLRQKWSRGDHGIRSGPFSMARSRGGLVGLQRAASAESPPRRPAGFVLSGLGYPVGPERWQGRPNNNFIWIESPYKGPRSLGRSISAACCIWATLPGDVLNHVREPPAAIERQRGRLSTMLRHSCGYKLANVGQDTRAIQHYLGHRSIASVRYTALAPDRFKGFWRD
jgi:Phage integrase family